MIPKATGTSIPDSPARDRESRAMRTPRALRRSHKIWANMRVVARGLRVARPNGSGSLVLQELSDHRGADAIQALRGAVASPVGRHQHGEVFQRGDPDDTVIHAVASGVLEDFAATPVAIAESPAEGVPAAEGRLLQLPDLVRRQQSR